jgi:hypothetical protein
VRLEILIKALGPYPGLEREILGSEAAGSGYQNGRGEREVRFVLPMMRTDHRERANYIMLGSCLGSSRANPEYRSIVV